MAYQHFYYKNAKSNESNALLDIQIGLDSNSIGRNTGGCNIHDIVVVSAEGTDIAQIGAIVKETKAQPWGTKYKYVYTVKWLHTNIQIPQDIIKAMYTSTNGNSGCMMARKDKLKELGQYVRKAILAK